jgi:hypothetical protein
MKCAIFAVLLWAAAAVLVLAANYEIESISPALDGAAKVGAIVLAAWAYVRLCAPHATLEHAVVVGVAWLVFAVVVEVFEASTTGRGWFDLIGSPAHPALRALLLVAWVGAPALFVRARSC